MLEYASGRSASRREAPCRSMFGSDALRSGVVAAQRDPCSAAGLRALPPGTGVNARAAEPMLSMSRLLDRPGPSRTGL